MIQPVKVLTPRSQAIAFRIWAKCQPLGWNLTIAECAEEMQIPVRSLRRVIAAKKWQTRFRAPVREYRQRGELDTELRF